MWWRGTSRKMKISYKWTDLLTEGAAVKVNGRIFVR